VTDDVREAFIEAAQSHLGAPYDYASASRAIVLGPDWMGTLARALRVAASMASKGALPAEGPIVARDVARPFLCSDYVFVVYDEFFQHLNPCNYSGGNASGGVWMPCAFFANPKFLDVDIETGAMIPL